MNNLFRLCLYYSSTILTLCALSPGMVTAGAAAAGLLEELGQPIQQILSHDQALGFGVNGEPQAYFIVGGNEHVTAEFAVVDIRSKQTVFSARIPRGDTSWAIDYSAYEKAVYIGVSSSAGGGELYRYRVGGDKIESLGVPLPGQRIWGIDVAPDGVVYVGTYPGGRLFSYDLVSGKVRDFGQVIPGETYVRGLEATETRVWFGTQPGAELGVLERATSKITRIQLPAPYASWGGATAYDIFARGERLFVRVTATNSSALLVYDVPTGAWVDAIDRPGTRSVSPINPADGKTVYFRLSNGHIAAYDIETLTYKDTGWNPNGIPGDFAWVDMQQQGYPSLSLVFTYYYGRVFVYNPVTTMSSVFTANLAGAANPLTAIATGPDDRIYLGAYLSPPGMSRFDPKNGRFELLASAGQVEGFGIWQGQLVYGRYPGGGLLRYDTKKAWSMGANPGAATTIEQEQDRPKGLAQVGNLLVAASVPATGLHGGALSLWNPQNRQVLYQGVPVPGAAVISGLAWGPDDRLYGLASGTLFAFDPATRLTVRTKLLSNRNYNFRYGDDQAIQFVDGQLYATTRGSLFHVDLATWDVTTLAGNLEANGLAVDADGNLYFIGRDTYLYRYRLP